MSLRKHLGILYQDDRCEPRTLYLGHQLVRALAQTQGEDEITPTILLGPRADEENHYILGDKLPEIVSYAYQRSDSPRMRMASWSRQLLSGRSTKLFEEVLETYGIDIVFPVTRTLGKRFSRAWAGWLPSISYLETGSEQREGWLALIIEAPLVVVSSECERKRLVQKQPALEDKLFVLSPVTVTSEEWFAQNPINLKKVYGLPKKYLICTTPFDEGSNHHAMISAVATLKQKGVHDVALVCTRSAISDAGRAALDMAKVQVGESNLTGHVSFLDLNSRSVEFQLIRGAAALIEPNATYVTSHALEDTIAIGKRCYANESAIHREQNPFNGDFFKSAGRLAELIEEDWPFLEMGPEPASEMTAQTRQLKRVQHFRNQFAAIVERAFALQVPRGAESATVHAPAQN